MKLLFIDLETSNKEHNNIKSIGAIDQNWVEIFKKEYHWRKQSTYDDFIQDFNETVDEYDCIVWHNILNHDLVHLYEEKAIDIDIFDKKNIDTLWLSSLVYIKKPYHKLIKDYKIDKTNDPIEDSRLCKEVFENCISKFSNIDDNVQRILYTLLHKDYRFKTFFEYYCNLNGNLLAYTEEELLKEINWIFKWLLEDDFKLDNHIRNNPLEFAYVFRLLAIKQIPDKDDWDKKSDELDREFSILPKWIIMNLPNTSRIIKEILNHKHYDLWWDKFNPEKWELWRFFHYKEFRDYPHEENIWNEIRTTLISQKDIIEQTLKWENILAILATWWGKSLTFQLPALINSDKIGCLTIVISPLQSLMKDQVDTLNDKDIQNVWFLNWLLNPLERRDVIERIEYWGIDILYISPEMLRSRNITKILSWRYIDRIVIDEAHCFSKWWHDFRTDYMFIADFIKELASLNPSVYDKDNHKLNVKISCFTATAKKDVTDEIKKYFKDNLWINLKVFLSTVDRENLHYQAIKLNDKKEKLDKIINFIKENVLDDISEITSSKDWCSCIVFVRTTDWAENLSKEINAAIWSEISAFYHWKLPSEEKRAIQNDFKDWIKRIIVATNAFWMGIDKDNVKYVIHFDIPASIENYVQEAWRAWRDINKVPDAQCIIYYTEEDVNKNLEMQKQSKLKKEHLTSLLKTLKIVLKNSKWSNWIQISEKELIIKSWLSGDRTKRVDWSIITDSKERKKEKIRQERYKSNLKQAIYHLEKLWFIKRWFNKTWVYATSKEKWNPIEANEIIEWIPDFKKYWDKYIKRVKEIYHCIESWRVISIEDIPDVVSGISTNKVEKIVKTLYKYKLIAYNNDISIIINPKELEKKFKNYYSLSQFNLMDQVLNEVVDYITEWLKDTDTNREIYFDRSKMITFISNKLWKVSLKLEITEVLNYLKNLRNNWGTDDWENDWTKWKFMILRHDKMMFYSTPKALKRRVRHILSLSKNILNYCIEKSWSKEQQWNTWIYKEISIPKVLEHVNITERIGKTPLNTKSIEESFRFLHNLWIIKVESWLFMFWTQLTLKKWDRYWEEFRNKDFDDLKTYYKQKNRQIHFMQKCAELFITSEWLWKKIIKDYFTMDHNEFVGLYYPNKELKDQLDWTITPERYEELFWKLDNYQKDVIKAPKNLLVLAWPWAWKTTVLVHKVASLILNEDINNEEFLFLTFSRAAMIELRKRVKTLKIPWRYNLEINTFHSYAYKILGKAYDNNNQWYNDKVIQDATKYLLDYHQELPFSVIVLDEFQDLTEDQYNFIKTIKDCSSQYTIIDENWSTIKEKEVRIIAAWDDDQAIYWSFKGNIKYIKEFKDDYKAEQKILPINYRSNQKIVDFTQTFIRKNKWRISEKNKTKFISKKWENLFDNNKIIKAINCSDLNYISHIPEYVKEIEQFEKLQWEKKYHIWVLCYSNDEAMNIAHIIKKSWYKNTSILLKDKWYNIANTLEFYEFIESFRNREKDKITEEDLKEKYEYVIWLFWSSENNINIQKLTVALEWYKKLYWYYTWDNLWEYFHDIDENDLNKNKWWIKITVSTMHKSKWLEFDSVISVFDAVNDISKDDWNDVIKWDEAARRLLYVSFTRAKDNLIIIWNEKIKFFNDVLDSLKQLSIKWWVNESKLIEINNKPIVDWDRRLAMVAGLEWIKLWFKMKEYIKWKSNYLPIWTEVKLSRYQSWENVVYKREILQWLSEKFSESLHDKFRKWYTVSKVQVYQRVTTYLKKELKKVVVYLFIFILTKTKK